MGKVQKKLIALEHIDYINYLLKIRCDCTGELEKDIIDKAILNELLPKETNIRWLATKILFPEKESDSNENQVCSTLAGFLEGISSGTLKVKNNENVVLEIINFIKNNEFRKKSTVVGKKRSYHFSNYCVWLWNLLEDLDDVEKAKKLNLNRKDFTSETKRVLDDIILATKEGAKEEDIEVLEYSPYIATLIGIISEYWEEDIQYGSHQLIDSTMRILIDLCYMADWDDSDENRFELLEIMKKFK